MDTEFTFDIIVVGAGHAGCEAAHAAATMGMETCLVTMDMEKIAQMSCNPAIGGIAKGQIVREIDALGGLMGLVTDQTAIQFRMLNLSKGPAMWSPRAQCDRMRYSATMRQMLENTPHLNLWQDQADELLVEQGHVCGVRTIWNVRLLAPCVIVTAGTFLNGLLHVGHNHIPGGRISEPACFHFSDSIARHGVRVGRLKTGTPVRIDGRSIDFSQLEEQKGDNDFHRFSYISQGRPLPQLPCWIGATNERVHEELRRGMKDSPLYNGEIQSIGPRYCPSIETKLHTFPDKTSHPLFVEPEGTNTHEYYLNGFSSSMPLDVQLRGLRQIPAFRDIVIYRPGYAIEYDYFDPTQMRHSLESKVIDGLFLAGQVNGTTGYEEAAGQGLVAGINAALKLQGKTPFVMKRDESYIGVLIDDLVTKGVDEPYRMFTSRAEYRILLRQDNADTRLTPYGIKLGLIDKHRQTLFEAKQADIQALTQYCETTVVAKDEINVHAEQLATTPPQFNMKLSGLLARPELNFKKLRQVLQGLNEAIEKTNQTQRAEIIEATEINLKYKGYIEREKQLAEKMHRLESIKIKGHFDYEKLTQLSIESRQKLSRIDPETIAQAQRIPGVSPSDINVLLVLMHR
ncbi:MAG: tRNA uridine-5-carboxymethylaminomethyl(34) synthesis enzyme MnmG [Prevotellaceae bacterium]|nr:tRNA uridine-5-carboxymethylaminomethyl(34) synthesis enzyme MnmG [Prevotellaceae bacterium]MDY3856233.1 tRNA uridine-5-carboxymethylaminomethyl(34) synthesis enzyme MnmG [Bacteroidaceae bacterium]